MNSFLLVISSPKGDVLREQATFFSARGSEGDLAIMAGHTPFVTTIKEGKCKIELKSGEVLEGNTSGGILTVTGEMVTLLSEDFIL